MQLLKIEQEKLQSSETVREKVCKQLHSWLAHTTENSNSRQCHPYVEEVKSTIQTNCHITIMTKQNILEEYTNSYLHALCWLFHELILTQWRIVFLRDILSTSFDMSKS